MKISEKIDDAVYSVCFKWVEFTNWIHEKQVQLHQARNENRKLYTTAQRWTTELETQYDNMESDLKTKYDVTCPDFHVYYSLLLGPCVCPKCPWPDKYGSPKCEQSKSGAIYKMQDEADATCHNYKRMRKLRNVCWLNMVLGRKIKHQRGR